MPHLCHINVMSMSMALPCPELALAASGLSAFKMQDSEVFSTEAWSLWIPEPSMLMSGTGKSSESSNLNRDQGNLHESMEISINPWIYPWYSKEIPKRFQLLPKSKWQNILNCTCLQWCPHRCHHRHRFPELSQLDSQQFLNINRSIGHDRSKHFLCQHKSWNEQHFKYHQIPFWPFLSSCFDSFCITWLILSRCLRLCLRVGFILLLAANHSFARRKVVLHLQRTWHCFPRSAAWRVAPMLPFDGSNLANFG